MLRADRVSAPPAKGWGSGLAEVSGLFHTKISVTFEPITSEQATKWAAAAPHTGAGLQVVKVKLTARLRANP
jgi:hypothetical protein